MNTLTPRQLDKIATLAEDTWSAGRRIDPPAPLELAEPLLVTDFLRANAQAPSAR